MLITAIPMLGIALAYRRLNDWHVSCGATYAWVAKAISLYFGWLTGWVMLLAYIVGATSCALPVGSYALSIFPNPWQESTVVSSVLGTVGIIAKTAIAYVGIRATSRFQAAGWDTAISLNEETEDSRVNPGRAVVAAVLGSAVNYTLLTFALQGAVKNQALQDNGANALAVQQPTADRQGPLRRRRPLVELV